MVLRMAAATMGLRMSHPTLQALVDRLRQELVPQQKVPPSVWAETHRHIAAESAEMFGRFSWTLVPYLRGVIDAFAEHGVRGIRCQKSAQIGWSESVLCNLLCYIIDVLPAPMMVLFPKLDKGKEFSLERFEPAIEVTPRLAAKVPLKTREKGITQTFKRYAGGWVKFVGSHSADAVKSSSVRFIFVEEPDDCEQDVKGQGRSIKLLRERLKTYYDTFSVMGGTPTMKGLSAIEAEMDLTDKRRWMVPCHHCGDAAPLDWANVKWDHDETRKHVVYGDALPETAYYTCAACGGIWNEAEKNANVRRGEWRATAPFTGLAGFYVWDMMSALGTGATMAEIARKYLEAKHESDAGDAKALVEFYNNQLGIPFEYKSPAPKEEELAERAEAYAELTVPWGGLGITIGVDVQPDRIALCVVAWGRGEESWRVYWGEIHGNVIDREDEVWAELERQIFRPFRHASGAEMFAEKISIDSGDGNTSDAVYWFCRKHRHRGVLAIRGVETGEIFRVPRPPIDPGRRPTKASRYGLQVWPVGTEKAKDLLIGFGEHGGRLGLCDRGADGRVATGSGAGRMHWYAEIRGDYYRQITAEVKAPKKGAPRGKLAWQAKQGVRNEALDCEVYALHAARALRFNLFTEAQWVGREMKLRQPDLVGEARLQAVRQEQDAGEKETKTEQEREAAVDTASADAAGQRESADAKGHEPAVSAPTPSPKPAPAQKPALPRTPFELPKIGGGESSSWL